ncbi:MAG: thiazole synthase [Deltaproteobacteria bacterium]|nr:thiazole synthase [Deltaproteobacteria bacterium]
MNDEFIIGGRSFHSRFLLGTGKFGNKQVMREAIIASQTEIVTVALRRIDTQKNPENIVSFIPDGVVLMVNTSGAHNAKEAIRIAKIAREAGYGDWVKIEVINDAKYLLPDNEETLKATEALANDGFIVLPYFHPDLYFARSLVAAGAAAIMPLGSLIGSNQGLKMEMIITVIVEEITEVPIIVDAGIGSATDAARAMEIGADAVLANTAVAIAENPVMMARSLALAVSAGRMGFLAKGGRTSMMRAQASSPLDGLLNG